MDHFKSSEISSKFFYNYFMVTQKANFDLSKAGLGLDFHRSCPIRSLAIATAEPMICEDDAPDAPHDPPTDSDHSLSSSPPRVPHSYPNESHASHPRSTHHSSSRHSYHHSYHPYHPCHSCHSWLSVGSSWSWLPWLESSLSSSSPRRHLRRQHHGRARR